jgi:hypothetical protein
MWQGYLFRSRHRPEHLSRRRISLMWIQLPVHHSWDHLPYRLLDRKIKRLDWPGVADGRTTLSVTRLKAAKASLICSSSGLVGFQVGAMMKGLITKSLSKLASFFLALYSKAEMTCQILREQMVYYDWFTRRVCLLDSRRNELTRRAIRTKLCHIYLFLKPVDAMPQSLVSIVALSARLHQV